MGNSTVKYRESTPKYAPLDHLLSIHNGERYTHVRNINSQ